VIGGSSLLKSRYFADAAVRIVGTPHGRVRLYQGESFIFCQRHEADPDTEYTLPHLINKRAIASAFLQLGVRKIVAFASVGSLRKEIPPGTVVLADDFFNLFDNISFHDDRRAHFVPVLESSPLRSEILKLLDINSIECLNEGLRVMVGKMSEATDSQ
jgi:5'-methylthioadenosine phosphorylase